MEPNIVDISELETRGFVNLRYPAQLRAGVEGAMRAWEAFCALPHSIKKEIPYTADGNVSGVGYELKLEKGEKKDLKEDFHLRLSEKEFLVKEAGKVGFAPLAFVEKALALNELIAPLVQEFADVAEEEFGLAGFASDTRVKQPRALLRFLHYFGERNVGDEIAAPHVDKGGFTLHLYESHPGLQYLTRDGQWLPMEFSHEQTAVIPALRLQYRSKNRLFATCHRVIATSQTAGPGRFSAVCFFDFANTPYFDKVRFGRQQDQKMAFNYTLPFEEFSQFFIDAH